MRFTKRIITQGQVTLPTDLRHALDIRAGDLVEFEVVGIVRPSKPRAQSPSLSLANPVNE